MTRKKKKPKSGKKDRKSGPDNLPGNTGAGDVAIVGLALRFPGATTLDEFWSHLEAGDCLISELPEDRWQGLAGQDALAAANGSGQRPFGGFIDQADCFDAPFFSISRREAQTMDPQQRFMLELSWQAIEDAGYAPGSLAGSRTGVYMGVCHWDYSELYEKSGLPVDAYLPTGLAYSIIANRISYWFDFNGPSVVNDTACSSSLVSVIQAVQALQSNDCDLALAGGVNLIWSPNHFIAFEKNGMLSKTGRSRVFDRNADGYVRGEGGAVLVLKPLRKALDSGDDIYAVIRGGGINHGGRTNSLTITSPKAQARLIREVYAAAGAEPETIGYIEAHGTGTPVGDPIEVLGLKMAFRELYEASGRTPVTGACGLGSVKTNIGHLEGAAGVAGMVKVIAALRNRTLPANAGFEEPNPLLKLDNTPFFIVDRTMPWSRIKSGGRHPLRAGVSSFGFGGTNAHVFLEEAPGPKGRSGPSHQNARRQEPGRNVLVPLSARNQDRLQDLALRLARHLDRHQAVTDLESVAWTLQTGRDPMAVRAAFVAEDMAGLIRGLRRYAADGTGNGIGCRVSGEDSDSGGPDEDEVRAWLDSGNVERLASVWAQGRDIDWNLLYPGDRPPRIHLPSHGFARERYWFPEPVVPEPVVPVPVVPVPAEADSAGTMPHQEINGPEPAGPEPAYPEPEPEVSAVRLSSAPGQDPVYSARVPAAHYLLAHHCIGSRTILPGTAVLELVREAAEQWAVSLPGTGGPDRSGWAVPGSGGIGTALENVIWTSPLEPRGDSLDVTISFTRDAAGNRQFQVASMDPGDNGSSKVRCQGRVKPAGTDDAVRPLEFNFPEDASRMPVAACYQRLDQAGICLGPGFRALQQIRWQGRLARARLALPESARHETRLWENHPVLMDAAIQASAALVPEDQDPGVPFAVERILFIAPCPVAATAVVRASDPRGGRSGLSRFDIDMVDDQGRVCIRIQGLATRSHQGTAGGAEPSLVRAVPQWEDCSWPGEGRRDQAITVLYGVTGSSGQVPAPAAAAPAGAAMEPLALPSSLQDSVGIETALLSVLQKARALLAESRRARLVIVLPESSMGMMLFPAMSGIAGTVNLESGRLECRVVLVPDSGAAGIADRLLSREILAGGDAAGIRLDGQGRRQVRRFIPLPRESRLPEKTWRGVWWINGGLGGLGRMLARHLVRSGAQMVVLSSRASREAAGTALAGLADLGDRVAYLPVDVADRAWVDRAVSDITSAHGRISGVIHAAGVLRDGLLLRKDDAGMTEVFRPKVRGVINLDAATAHLDLDLFVAFSSIASLYGSPGQADYAGANGFLDGFAAWRSDRVRDGSRSGRTVAVNWPLFADGGMQADREARAAMERRMGVVPMPGSQGMAALDLICFGDESAQVAVGFGRAGTMTRFFYQGSAPALTAGLSTVTAAAEPGMVVPPVPAGEPVEKPSPGSRQQVTALLRHWFAEVLVMDPAKVRPDVEFQVYGFDSIVAVELINRLETCFGDLPKTLFFEHVNLDSVADWLMEERAGQVAAAMALMNPATGSAVSGGRETRVPDTAGLTRAGGDGSRDAAPAGLRTQDVPVPERPAGDRPRRSSGPLSLDLDDLHDIAVIGVGGRYPGSDSLEEFWENLCQGRHAFEPVPADRWPHEDIYHPGREVLGKSVIRTGSFLRDIDRFDPRYFNISQSEAELMSPEVRLMLQVAVETFEDAGYSREYIQDRMDGNVGVLAGTMSNHYNLYGVQNMMTRGARASGSYTGTLPNMISYYYGLTGPSIFVDTMCSSASAAIDMGVRMLRTRQCRMVLAGGINLLLHPYNLISSSQEHFTTSTAEIIRSFGIGADGTILGEGAGAVLLKPLGDARRDGDAIRAVIRGTALTNAGVRNGFTVPSPSMQARAVRMALDDARVSARTISYVEGHGSGTSLGDPIEIAALTQAFQQDTSDTGFCAIGSVKSNLAHLLAAAGVVGFTKLLLQMRHGELVPSLHSDVLNPAIHFEASPFAVQQQRSEWKRPVVEINGRQQTIPRRAGLTSIGAGGVNSHIIVEEYVAPEPPARVPGDVPRLLVFSAMHPGALERVIHRMITWLRSNPGIDHDALAYTLQVGRTALPCRLAFEARTPAGATKILEEFLAGKEDPEVFHVETILDADMPPNRETMARSCQRKDLPAVASGWVAGAAVDWDALWGDSLPRRIPLPTYPFEQVRCWYQVFEDAPGVLDPEGFRRKRHPFITRNISDIRTVGFETDVRLEEILDYTFRIRNRPLVVSFAAADAALAALECAGVPPERPGGDTVPGMPAAAGSMPERLLSAPVTLSRLRWSACDWEEAAALTIGVALVDGSPEDTPSADVRIDWTGRDGQSYAWFRARARYGAGEPGTVSADVARMQPDAGGDTFDQDALEQLWASGGITYSVYLRVVTRLHVDAGGIGVARFQPPDYCQDRHKNLVFFPQEALGALHQLGQVMAWKSGMENWSRVEPLSADSLFVAGDLARACELRFSIGRTRSGLSGTVGILDRDGTLLGWVDALEYGLPGQAGHTMASHTLASQQPAHPSGPDAAADVRSPGGRQAGLEKHGNTGTAAVMADDLRHQMAKILKFPDSEIANRSSFYSLGFNSITLTELTDRINARYRIRLVPSLFYEVENLEKLVAHLMDAGVRPAADDSAGTAPAAPPVSMLQPALEGTGHGPGFRAQGMQPAGHRSEAPASQGAVAIIGAACRFPGAPDLDAFWDLLIRGKHAITRMPMERYGSRYGARLAAAAFPDHGGFLSDIDRFDADFFSIAPVEAERMDPQHRIFLETAWLALESAGWRPGSVPGNTGVFVGVSGTDYATVMTAHGIEADAHTATGNSHAVLANRLSFFLDIHGPSQAIDTACSSSLVAVHRAAEMIRAGTCDMAIAGGVAVNLSLESFAGPYEAGILSQDGRCRTLAAGADGYVRGEGAGVVILKSLAAAERDGDPVLGTVIRSAENHGGRAASLTAPNPKAQADLIVEAMKGLDPASIDYVELHGTGTRLGDSVEVNGLKAAFARLAADYGETRIQDPGCGLGSVKTNIGHLEAAAGIAGLIKLVLALEHSVLPLTLHCEEPNPYLDFTGTPFFIQDQARPWTRKQDADGAVVPRRAGLSSFGFGGANAHLVLQEPIAANRPQQRQTRVAGEPAAIVLSGRTRAGLNARVDDLLRYLPRLERTGPDALDRLAFTLQEGREPMEERLAVAVESLDDLARELFAWRNAGRSGVVYGHARLDNGFPDRRGQDRADPGRDPQGLPAHEAHRPGDLARAMARWVAGGHVDWARVRPVPNPGRLFLPGYRFSDDRYWFPLDRDYDAVFPETRERIDMDAQVEQVLEAVISGRMGLDSAVSSLEELKP